MSNRVGVFGGTFDPVHIGHLLLAERAGEQLELERVLWVPAGDPWRKSGQAVSSAADREAMVRLAIEGNDAFELSRIEIERKRRSYTVETLAALAKQLPERSLYLILGLDALRDLPNWREPERILELATLAVALRGVGKLPSERLERMLPGMRGRVVWVNMPRVDISGTELRTRVTEGRSVRYALPESVLRYVGRKRLYQE